MRLGNWSGKIGYLQSVFKRRIARMDIPFGYALFPETIFVYMTYRCNLKCKMCPQYGQAGKNSAFKSGKAKDDEMSFEHYRTLIDEAAKHRSTMVFSGGEPMLHRDFVDIITEVKSRDLSCNIVTNGYLLERHAELLFDIGLDSLVISIDGPRKVHNEIRGLPDTFERAEAGVRKLVALKRTHGKKIPRIMLSSAMTPDSYGYIEDTVAIAEDWGADSINLAHLTYYEDTLHELHTRHMERMFPDCGYLKGLGQHYGDLYAPIDLERIRSVIHNINSRKNRVQVSFSPGSPGQFADEEITAYYDPKGVFRLASKYGKCIRNASGATIEPNGDVIFCWGHQLGNLKMEKLTALWNNSRARDFRLRMRHKTLPLCVRCCNLYARNLPKTPST